jgi:hypothetical protein
VEQKMTAPVELTRYDVVSDKHGAFLRVFGNPVGPVQGAQPVYTTKDADQLLASLREQLSCAQSEAKFCREHLERERKDAARYRWLGDLKCNSLYLTRNTDHATNYMTAKEWIEEQNPEWYAEDPPEEVQRMKDTNTIWSLQVYPDTPIGSYTWNAASLDAAIDQALASLPGSEAV